MKDSDKRLLDFVRLTLDAPLLQGSWHDVLDCLVDLQGGFASALFAAEPDFSTRQLLGVSEFYRNDGADIVERFQSGDDSDDRPAFQALLAGPEQKLRSEHDLYGLPPHVGLPPSRFRDFQESRGITARYASLVNNNGKLGDILLLNTGSNKPVLSQSDIEFFDTAGPILARSVRLFRIFETLRQQFGAALQAFDHLQIGVALSIDDGQVISANRSAEEILKSRDGLWLDQSRRLACSDQDLGPVIHDACVRSKSTADLEDIFSGKVISISRPSGAVDYILTIGPLRDTRGELSQGLTSALVFIVDPSQPSHVSVEGLAKIADLSPAELEVASMIVRGLATEAIAEERGVSLGTTRQQIKACLAKLGCSSRLDLLRLAFATRLPLTDGSADL